MTDELVNLDSIFRLQKELSRNKNRNNLLKESREGTYSRSREKKTNYERDGKEVRKLIQVSASMRRILKRNTMLYAAKS